MRFLLSAIFSDARSHFRSLDRPLSNLAMKGFTLITLFALWFIPALAFGKFLQTMLSVEVTCRFRFCIKPNGRCLRSYWSNCIWGV